VVKTDYFSSIAVVLFKNVIDFEVLDNYMFATNYVSASQYVATRQNKSKPFFEFLAPLLVRVDVVHFVSEKDKDKRRANRGGKNQSEGKISVFELTL